MKKNFFPFLLILIVLFGCKSTPATENSTEGALATGGTWLENQMSSATQCGFFYTSPETVNPGSYEVEFKKESGYSKAAFGIIFGYTAKENGLLENYNRFEINVDGEYALYQVSGSTYTDLVEANNNNTAYFIPSSAIKKGFSQTNILKIEFSNNMYSCYINGTQVAKSIPLSTNGENKSLSFFSVGKENQEVFPDTPVKISYRIK
jgi:hypothetical protein